MAAPHKRCHRGHLSRFRVYPWLVLEEEVLFLKSRSPSLNDVVSGPGTLSGSTLTITGAGSIVIAANQAADANHVVTYSGNALGLQLGGIDAQISHGIGIRLAQVDYIRSHLPNGADNTQAGFQISAGIA